MFFSLVSFTNENGKDVYKSNEYKLIHEIEHTKTIDNKIAAWMITPPQFGEPMYLFTPEYTKKSTDVKYRYDYLMNKKGVLNGGKRIITIYLFLNNVTEGGEIIFPKVSKLSIVLIFHYAHL